MIIAVLTGYFRGLILSVARIVAMIVSYLGAAFVATAGKQWVGSWICSAVLQGQDPDSLFGTLAQPVLQETGEGIAYTVLFFVAFLLLEAVLLHVVNLLKLVDHIPVVGKLNKLGGAVAGFFWMFLICLLLGNVFFSYVPKEVQKEMGFTKKAIKETILLNVFVP